MKLIFALALVATVASPVYAGPLPPLINFQSVLLDEGGNLLPSGPATIQFQILDEIHEPIYFENQSVDVVKGAVSALVGNGSDDQGITTGGIPEDVFATGAPRYLQVQVGSQTPEAPMTIVPVPYSQWSQTSATVADGAVSSAKIAQAAVGFEHLAPDLIDKLAEELSKSHGILTEQGLASIGGATQVGVTAKFINSGSSSVQGVLQDIDLSVKKGQEQDQFLLGQLKDEIKNRTEAVAGVQGKLDEEVTNRTSAVKGVQDNLNAETVTRAAADGGLQGQITPIQTTLLDINNIPGKLKLDHLDSSSSATGNLNMGQFEITGLAEPTTDTSATNKKFVTDEVAAGVTEAKTHADDNFKTAPSDLNMNGKKITSLGTPATDTDASTKKYVDDAIKVANPATSPIPPVLTGELSMAGGETKFVPFSDEPEILAGNTCGDLSGHNCNYAELSPSDDKLFYCKIKSIKFNLQGHAYSNGGGLYAACEYVVGAQTSSINDSDGGNLDYSVQRGIIIHLYRTGDFTEHDNDSDNITVSYALYEIPVSTQ